VRFFCVLVSLLAVLVGLLRMLLSGLLVSRFVVKRCEVMVFRCLAVVVGRVNVMLRGSVLHRVSLLESSGLQQGVMDR
jgi:hypothetical protein